MVVVAVALQHFMTLERPDSRGQQPAKWCTVLINKGSHRFYKTTASQASDLCFGGGVPSSNLSTLASALPHHLCSAVIKKGSPTTKAESPELLSHAYYVRPVLNCSCLPAVLMLQSAFRSWCHECMTGTVVTHGTAGKIIISNAGSVHKAPCCMCVM